MPSLRRGRTTACLLTVLLAALLVPAAAASGPAADGRERAPYAVPLPTLTTPPDGLRGHPLWDSWHDLAPFGFEEEEFLVSGTARSEAGEEAPFTTRMIVSRPVDPADFNGTVLLDWVNVTAQFENPVELMEAREHLLREGFAFVHASAQAAGLCCHPLTPQGWDPLRYAAIDHPGDDFAADVFLQMAKAAATPEALGGLRARRVIASGQSQSASRLSQLLAGPLADNDAVDAYLVHGGGEKQYADPLPAPVVHLLSDREATPEPGDDDPRYRLWEVAATAHTDLWVGYQSVAGSAPRYAGGPQVDRSTYRQVLATGGQYGEQPTPLHAACVVAGATLPTRYSVNAAIDALDRWVRTGEPAVRAPRVRFAADGTLAADAFGNTLGGIRLPPVEVPVARWRSTACPLGGVTEPFPDVRLVELHGSFAEYRAAMAAATGRAVRRRWVLPADARDQMRRVCGVRGRFGEPDAACPAYRPPAPRVR